MSKSTNRLTKQPHAPQKVNERPLDPTRDAEDFIGDPTGRTGVTTGDPRQISAEPDELTQDDSVIVGGVIEDPMKINPIGITEDQVSDKAYEKKIMQGLSEKRFESDEDLASETDDSFGSVENTKVSDTDDLMGTHSSYVADGIPVAESGEEEVSGTAPDVESDDDVGDMMKRVTGIDPDPDMDNPQELGIGEDLDEAEENIRTS